MNRMLTEGLPQKGAEDAKARGRWGRWSSRFCLFRPRRLALGLAVLAANWPVLRWYADRLGDGGDEPWGLAALVAALALTPRTQWCARIPNTSWIVAALLAVGAALSAGHAPMLVRAAMLAASLGLVLGGGAGVTGLLGLSLPILASAQFYAGYPLRVLTAEAGRPLLAALGVATERTGVVLNWAGGAVLVDAPCSGVRMLWMGAVLACALAAWRQLSGRATASLLAFAVVGVLAANAVRAALLFMVESGIWAKGAWVHETVGAIVFGVVGIGLWSVADRLAWCARERVRADAAVEQVGAEPGIVPAAARRFSQVGWIVWVLLAAVLAAAPVWRAETVEEARVFPGWPDQFEGKPWEPVGPGGAEAEFASGFSGETQVFRQGERLVILRWIRAASRGVHPAADCFRARGYRVAASTLVLDEAGVRWSEFVAERGGERWRVRERWRDERGESWTDVSAWWWAAQAAGAHGPWWAETVAWPE
jgi:exosortase/archaeosortase family protein